jgi:signal transduction histidine kinase/ActR/RegA family two-component response regulator
MRRLRLRTLLALLVLVTTIPIALFAAWLISRSSTQREAMIDRQNIEQARAVIVAVDQELEDVIASLNVLALLDPIDAPDKVRFAEVAERIIPAHRYWESIRLIDLSLRVVASTSGASSSTPLPHPEWATRVIQTRQPAVSPALQEPAGGRWMVTVGVPVVRNGDLKYVLTARLYATAFSEILKRQHAPPGGVVTLLDDDPKIIARTLNEEKYIGYKPMSEFIARSRDETEGSWRSVTLEGTRSYSAWSRSTLTGWTIGIGLPEEPVVAPVRRSFTALIAAALGICGAALMLALILGRNIVRGQTAAAEAARALARGERPARFGSHIVETHDLADGLTDAAAILEQRLRERDQAQAEADRHRAALLDREKSARRAAEALNRAKDEFIATVSHELRTPLNAIFGWVSLLRLGTLDPARQTHALDVIERNTRAQAQLVEDLLDMSRVIQGNVRLCMEPLDLAVVLESSIESLRPTADARRIAISAHTPRGIAVVSGDPGRLQQVVWNILSNAVKFTAPGGRIDASVEARDSEAIVCIADSGEGIAPEFLPHVFDRFRQENAAVTRTHSGLGLGLSLVRHLVELHGGTIQADSDGKGKGAMFSVRLPLLGATPGAPTAPLPSAPADLNTIRDRRVLVIDDDADTRELAAEALTQAGVRVALAASAAEALKTIAAERPDAIVADIGTPLVNGCDFVRQLRADPQLSAIPTVALITFGGAEARDAALTAGFSAYVRMPYDPRTLVALLSGLIAASGDSMV